MTKEERHSIILDMLLKSNSILVTDLAEQLSSNLRQLVQEVIYLEQMLAAQIE